MKMFIIEGFFVVIVSCIYIGVKFFVNEQFLWWDVLFIMLKIDVGDCVYDVFLDECGGGL